MLKKLIYPTSMLIVCCTITLPVLASSSDLAEGIKLYNAKEFASARPILAKAVSESPKSWRAHYYLANVNLVLGKASMAKYHYEACLQNCTNPTIVAHCNAGIARVDKHSSQANVAANKSEDEEQTKGAKPISDADVQKEKRKAEIMRLAKEDVEKIRKQTKEQLESEIETHGQAWRNRETGERRFGISKDREAEIEREGEERSTKIMQEAERKIRAMN